jgi:hypothetical protein
MSNFIVCLGSFIMAIISLGFSACNAEEGQKGKAVLDFGCFILWLVNLLINIMRIMK